MLTMEQARVMRGDKRLSGDRNQCAGCGLLFNSTRAFDKHRAGSYGTGDGLPAARRCLSREEMEQSGMALNAQGFWVTERQPEAYLNQLEQQKAAVEALEASGNPSQVLAQQ
ncbi:hypothetical protein [Caballeronia sp. LZ035]|uniref:hypothetical protein n=1 Tax=Caballeronia sp. LZ035 TaxID=3038568 RepID=UPI002859406F|nr:hypothetical protein [Caballeronia sp. LZ035]MDR5757890.1 hypothetical protein [Caballeronia sp. LZ035]